MPAGEFFRAALRWHQLYQNAIGARTRVFFATIVDASGGVFENEARSPRPARSSILALFKEIELMP
jgi:hypothetical protein